METRLIPNVFTVVNGYVFGEEVIEGGGIVKDKSGVYTRQRSVAQFKLITACITVGLCVISVEGSAIAVTVPVTLSVPLVGTMTVHYWHHHCEKKGSVSGVPLCYKWVQIFGNGICGCTKSCGDRHHHDHR